ncbi:MAG TPA: ABC transporter substrate-binding protein [Anaerolineae bacterium]|nr:ABC transporter substrate-binding protein [Anaerolineae bacterium]
MLKQSKYVQIVMFLLLGWVLVACRDGEPQPVVVTPSSVAATAVPPTMTPTNAELGFVTVAVDVPNPPYADFNMSEMDAFGEVTGFDVDVLGVVAGYWDWDYELVVTSYEGMLSSVARGEFDMALAALPIDETAESVAGIAYTEPYLELGQVMVVRANETEIVQYNMWPATELLGVVQGTASEKTAQEELGVSEANLRYYETTAALLQALIDGAVRGAVVDSDDARYYTANYWQQLKIVGEQEGSEAWITYQAYGMAVADDNDILLAQLNEAIGATAEARQAAVTKWLVSVAPLDAGDSLVGTPEDQVVVGIVADEIDLDTTATADLVNWEILYNTSGGLFAVDAETEAIVPALAAELTTLSEDKLEYTFTLQEGLVFPDGRPLTAEDVKFSVERARGLGVLVVNGILKDDDGDGFADADAVRVLNERQVSFRLQEPTSHFLYLLSTPPYFVVSQACFESELNPIESCLGVGPYRIVNWEEGEQIDLEANGDWPGPAPIMDKVQIRLYQDTARMQESLNNRSLDIGWTGLSDGDLQNLRRDPNLEYAQGASFFKSYMVFEQSQPPWNDRRARQAVAYAVDREALAEVFEGSRIPSYSPIPAGTAGQVDSQPTRDLDQARELLAQAGYTRTNPLLMDLWYINDGRYGPYEGAYAEALKEQLEETGAIRVTLEGAGWNTYRVQMSQCEYPAFLLGWPTPGQPPRAPEPTSWINYFIYSTATLCSNYESPTMLSLAAEALEVVPTAEEEWLAAYGEIQRLWAQEYPTLDLVQVPRVAVHVAAVDGVAEAIGATGVMHYGVLQK